MIEAFTLDTRSDDEVREDDPPARAAHAPATEIIVRCGRTHTSSHDTLEGGPWVATAARTRNGWAA